MEIALNPPEAEHIALNQAIRDKIALMELMKEVSFYYYFHLPNPEVFCKVFKDNTS